MCYIYIILRPDEHYTFQTEILQDLGFTFKGDSYLWKLTHVFL